MANATLVPPQVLNEPGVLYWAPPGTAEPTHTVAVGGQSFTDSWSNTWIPLGPTIEGMNFTYGTNLEPIRVAEFLDPVQQVATERNGSIGFALASITLANVKKAFNGGALTVVAATASAGQYQTYEPPAPTALTRAMIGWESTDSSTRIIIRRSLNAAELNIQARRGTDIASIPCEFRMETTAGSTVAPFVIVTAGTNRA
jgi:hypothetical protein